MSRRSALRTAYNHETAFASQMAQAFAVAADLPSKMRAALDRLDAAQQGSHQSLPDRIAAIKILTEAEAGLGQAASHAR